MSLFYEGCNSSRYSISKISEQQHIDASHKRQYICFFLQLKRSKPKKETNMLLKSKKETNMLLNRK